MDDGLGQVETLLTRQRKNAPIVTITPPIERGLPAMLLHRCPTVREPEFGLGIAARRGELGEFAACDRTVRETKRIHPDAVARTLIVKGEICALMADLNEPTGELDKSQRSRLGSPTPARRLIGRQQRVQREHMLDVHQDQLLMLLLMMQAELD